MKKYYAKIKGTHLLDKSKSDLRWFYFTPSINKLTMTLEPKLHHKDQQIYTMEEWKNMGITSEIADFEEVE